MNKIPDNNTPTHSLQVLEKNHILTLCLNRPDVLNAIDMEMAQALMEQLKHAANNHTVRVVVITGNGRAFCAGGDLKFALQANQKQPGDSLWHLRLFYMNASK